MGQRGAHRDLKVILRIGCGFVNSGAVAAVSTGAGVLSRTFKDGLVCKDVFCPLSAAFPFQCVGFLYQIHTPHLHGGRYESQLLLSAKHATPQRSHESGRRSFLL